MNVFRWFLLASASLFPISSATDVLVAGDSWAQSLGSLLSKACPGKSVVNMGNDVTAAASLWGPSIINPPVSCPGRPLDFPANCTLTSVNAFNKMYGSGYTHVWMLVGGIDFMSSNCGKSSPMLFDIIRSATTSFQNAAPPGAKLLMTGYAAPPETQAIASLGPHPCSFPENWVPLQSTIKSVCESVKGCTYIDISSSLEGNLGSDKSSVSKPKLACSKPKYFKDEFSLNEEGTMKILKLKEIQSFFGCPYSQPVSFLHRSKSKA